LRTTNDLAGTTERPLRTWYDPQTDVVLRGAATVVEGRRIVQPSLRLPVDANGRAIEVSAAEAHYLEATNDHPAGYLFVDVDAGGKVLEETSIQIDGRVTLYSPSDAPWLEAGQVFWPSDVEFDQLAADPSWRHFASTAELVDYVKRPARDAPASTYVTLHGRLVRPVLDFGLAVIGLPLVLSRRGRSPFLAVGLAMGVIAGFLLVALTCEFLGNSGWIGPSLAAWLPLFVFVPLAVATSGDLRR
jgi:lipopolysaccharide export system permease protein